MKVLNVLKNGLVVAALLSLVGCASVSGVTNKMVNNKTEGVIYGFAGIDNTATVKSICDGISNKDTRCKNPNDYVLVPVYAKSGFADGAVGINALVKKDFPGLDALNHKMVTGSSKAPYVKAKVIPGQLGELVEIVSTNGDGKCYWSGLPRVGGVVCPAYNYDYRKDYIGVVFR